MLSRRAFVGSAALLLAGRPLRARTKVDAAKLAEIRPRMQRFVDEGLIAGAVTMVGLEGTVVHHEAVGQQDREARRPMRPDCVFRIASMTKPITALALMMLEEQGRLSVDDPVEKHLPEFRGIRLVKSKNGEELVLGRPARPPTLKDLLTHTSGMPSMPPPGFAELYERRDRTLAEAVSAFSQVPLDFEPGSKWSYCNAGIDTVGRVVEAVSGQTFERFLDARIFRPLGMTDTACYCPRAGRARLAALYKARGDGLEKVESWLGGDDGGRYPLPAGGLFSTARDLSRLYFALLDGGRRLVRPETLARMTTLHTGHLRAGFVPGQGFGLGFAVIHDPQGVNAMLSPGSYGHGGAFGTQAWLDPGKKMFFVLLIQRDGTPGGDASEPRRALQELAVAALG